MAAARVELAALAIADPPERWRELGFAVDAEGRARLGGVELVLGGEGRGITGWTLRNASRGGPLQGLATTVTSGPAPSSPAAADVHPNGAIGIDHVVVVTGDFDRAAAALDRAGMPLRRIRDAGGGIRQGFRRLGPAILELVEAPGVQDAAFWGLVVVVGDLPALAASLGPRLGEIREAVQPGRHIAALQRSAGLSPRVAFMDPE